MKTDEEIVREAWPGVTRDQLSFALHVAPAFRKAALREAADRVQEQRHREERKALRASGQDDYDSQSLYDYGYGAAMLLEAEKDLRSRAKERSYCSFCRSPIPDPERRRGGKDGE